MSSCPHCGRYGLEEVPFFEEVTDLLQTPINPFLVTRGLINSVKQLGHRIHDLATDEVTMVSTNRLKKCKSCLGYALTCPDCYETFKLSYKPPRMKVIECPRCEVKILYGTLTGTD